MNKEKYHFIYFFGNHKNVLSYWFTEKKSILDFVHHFNVNLLLQDKSRLLFMSVAKIHTVCFTFRCIFSRHIGSIIPCIFWYAYLILKLLSWSHLVPKSIWNPPIINSIRRNPTTSGCYLYNINLPIPVAKNALLGETNCT